MATQIIAITKFIGATDRQGKRIQVRYMNHRRNVPFYHGWDTDNVGREAIAELFHIPLDAIGYGGIDNHYIVTLPDMDIADLP